MNFPFIFDLSLTSFIGVCVCSFTLVHRNRVRTYEFLMPYVDPYMETNHLCMKIAIYNNFYLVGFEPKASSETVHQMLLYGCTVPGSNDTIWSCTELPTKRRSTLYDSEDPCINGSQIIYGWAGNASGYQLPRGVGFHVGKDSDIKYLVLQVHYKKTFTESDSAPLSPKGANDHRGLMVNHHRPPHAQGTAPRLIVLVRCDSHIVSVLRRAYYRNDPPSGREKRQLRTVDNSGFILSYTRRRMSRLAGVLVLGTRGVIPPNAVEHMESTCTITEEKIIHPLAFRVHTHRVGSLVSCYVVRQGKVGDSWTTLAKKSPAKPQAFYPVKDGSPVRKGDILASRCTMNNTSNYYITIGNRNTDEMCRFQLLYWADSKPLDLKFCISPGPPAYYWNRALENFHNIPDFHASVL